MQTESAAPATVATNAAPPAGACTSPSPVPHVIFTPHAYRPANDRASPWIVLSALWDAEKVGALFDGIREACR